MSKIVVYTAISHGSGWLRPIPETWRKHATFVAFLKRPIKIPGWEIRPLYQRFRDAHRNVTIHKILPQRYFPKAEYSLWVDETVELTAKIPLLLWIRKYLAQSDLAAFEHPLRDCLFREAAASMELDNSLSNVIWRQMQKYRNQGFPYDNCLAECAVLLRRHTRHMHLFGDLWFKEFKAHSGLEQLSFHFAVRQLKLKYSHLPGSVAGNPYFAWRPQVRLREMSSGNRGDHPRILHANRARQKAQSDVSSVHDGKYISMVFLYYDNVKMLKKQIMCWNSYADVWKNPPEILLIDDGSPKTFAADIIQKCGCKIPIKVYRIWENIAWNFSGARNLGCSQATSWIYVSDIDTLLFAEDAKKLFSGRPLHPNVFYMPKRVRLPNLAEAEPGIVNLLFHKSKYTEMGGYDEDYAGYYGREETDFYKRLQHVAKKKFRKNVLIRVMPRTIVSDAWTRTPWPRDKTRNNAIFEQKENAGFPKPKRPLRFSWDRVL